MEEDGKIDNDEDNGREGEVQIICFGKGRREEKKGEKEGRKEKGEKGKKRKEGRKTKGRGKEENFIHHPCMRGKTKDRSFQQGPVWREYTAGISQIYLGRTLQEEEGATPDKALL